MKFSMPQLSRMSLAAAILAVSLSPIALANDMKDMKPCKSHHCPPPCHMDHKMDHKAEMNAFENKIGLSASQKKQVEAAHEASESQIRPLMDQLHQKRMALMQYMAQPNATQSQAMTMQQDILNTQNQIETLHLQNMFTMKSFLTPAQQQKAAMLMQEKMDMKKMHPMMDGTGMPGDMPAPGPGMAPPPANPPAMDNMSQPTNP